MNDAWKIINNPHETSENRAKALLGLMTVTEKAGQLNQRLYGFNVYKRTGDTIEISDEFKEEVERFGGIGVLYGLYRADPWADKDENTGITPKVAPNAYNKLQKYVIENSRLHIPMMVSSECPHGHQALSGGLLPVNLAVGATFDPNLLHDAYASLGKQLKANKVDLALMSVLDVLRDPRWGRSEECYSEDPYLASRLAYSAISGMQSEGVSAVAKHLCAQGQTTGGVNASAATIGERELREIHLPVVKAVCEANTASVMAAYNEIDGVYCHANKKLLTDILRNEFGFKGFVMADGCALDALNTVTSDSQKSGALALSAGVDVSLWDKAFTLLPEALEEGLITVEELDRAVLRVLTLKFERGLFENPYMDEEPKEADAYGINDLSQQLAEESAVLLKNDGTLPIRKCKKILVTGPNADDIYRQLGDYTPPVKKEETYTVLRGLEELLGKDAKIVYVPGNGLFELNEAACDKAALAAKDCDVAVVVVGGSSSRFESASFDINGAAIAGGRTYMDCGEGMDVADIRLKECQVELIRRIAATGTKVVTVVISGRPLGLEEALKDSNALLQCFYPGPMGGLAVAKLIYGLKSPSGRLPASLPKDSGCLPCYYNSRDSYKPGKYSDVEKSVLFEFGEGLSYSNFKIDNCKLSDDKELSFTITNTGDVTATAVPMLFVHHKNTQAVSRRRELKWFKRIPLEAGKSVKISEKLDESAFYTLDVNLNLVKEKGVSEYFLTEGGKEFAHGEVLR